MRGRRPLTIDEHVAALSAGAPPRGPECAGQRWAYSHKRGPWRNVVLLGYRPWRTEGIYQVPASFTTEPHPNGIGGTLIGVWDEKATRWRRLP